MANGKKITFVNIIFFVLFGVLTGVLWAFACPIQVVPGLIHLRTFAFLIVVIAYLFGPITGFFSGYIGTLVWSLIAGTFVPLHSPLADGILVGLSAALPALIQVGKKPLEEVMKNKKKFILVCLGLSLLFGVLMILGSCASLVYIARFPYGYWYCVLWMGIADIAPIALAPFIIVLLAPRLKKLQTMVPYC